MFSYFQGVYNSVCLAKNTYYIHQSIHEHVSKLARFLAKSDEMYQEYHHLFEDKLLESQYKPFPKLLQCSLYKNPDCLWNNKGKLLVDFLSVSKNRDTTHPLFNFLGPNSIPQPLKKYLFSSYDRMKSVGVSPKDTLRQA